MAAKSSKGKKGTQRKLTAILSADVAGYSRLMGDDEEATVATLGAYRKVFTSEIKKHRGRVVDAKGDALLAEFAAVTNAVSCAVEIQRELAERNTEFPDNRRMDFRIGINLGEVMVKGEEIYGDGVNVAARLESLAEPGGICISRSAYDQVESKLNLECEYLGEQQVKNIAKPVRAYRVETQLREKTPQGEAEHVAGGREESEPTSYELVMGEPPPQPDQPSIAVLAFENMSGDPDQEYFSDGISEDIITDLSKISNLFVIARNASFTYKGRSVNPKQVAGELGVRYVLEGSVRKAGSRVRITAQLIEAATGNHLWAERYDRELEDVFAVQDDITAEIVTALHVKLVRGEQARIRRKSLRNPQARDLFYRGIESFNTLSKDGMVESRKFHEEVIRLEPDAPAGYMGMAQAHFYDAVRRWSDNRDESLKSGMEHARQAIALDELDAWPHALIGALLMLEGKHNEALITSERAVALAPNYADVVLWAGWIMIFSGLYEEGILKLRRAIRLCPIAPALYLTVLAAGLVLTGRYEETIAFCSQASAREPDYATPYFFLAVAFSALGRYEEALKAAEGFRNVSPHTPQMQEYAKQFPFNDPAFNQRWADALNKAGIE